MLSYDEWLSEGSDREDDALWDEAEARLLEEYPDEEFSHQTWCRMVQEMTRTIMSECLDNELENQLNRRI